MTPTHHAHIITLLMNATGFQCINTTVIINTTMVTVIPNNGPGVTPLLKHHGLHAWCPRLAFATPWREHQLHAPVIVDTRPLSSSRPRH